MLPAEQAQTAQNSTCPGRDPKTGPPVHPVLAPLSSRHRNPAQGPPSRARLGPGSQSTAPSHTHPDTLASAGSGQPREEKEIISAALTFRPNRRLIGQLESTRPSDSFSAATSDGRVISGTGPERGSIVKPRNRESTEADGLVNQHTAGSIPSKGSACSRSLDLLGSRWLGH